MKNTGKSEHSTKESTTEYALSNNRWIYIFLYLLPVSVFSEICSLLKKWVFFKLYSSPKHHDSRARDIQKQVRQWIRNGEKSQIRIYSSGCQNDGDEQTKNNFYNIKVNLLDILDINNEKQTVKLEPLVTINQLISTLIPLGWTIPVVPGIDDLTIGSVVLGTGIDSSSHKYGSFHDTCVSYELVLCDGSLVVCSEEKNSDLFHAVPWSYGTLGILTAIEIKMIPAHNFVKLQFKGYHNETLAMKKFLEECDNKKNDFVEGLLYTQNQCMVVTGQMVGQIESNKLNEMGKWYKPWFFQHAKSYFIKGFGTEYIPIKDYYFRHTRSTYWELQDIIPFGNNIFFRMLFGWAVPMKFSFFKMTQARLIRNLCEKRTVMLDLMVPADKLQTSIDTFNDKVEIYPIWLCPVKITNSPGFVHTQDLETLYISIGIYGSPKAHGFHPTDTLKEVEKFVREVKGFRMLSGDFQMSEDEFREQFDHTLYDQVRNKFNCQKAFPSVFEKLKLMKNEKSYNKNMKELIM